MKEKQGMLAEHLDPGSIFEEILFGLIMVLTFTLGAGLAVEDGPGAIRTLLIAAIGCNIAWGIIDGAMYIMGNLLDRGRRNRILLSLNTAPDEAAALAAIGRELDAPLAALTSAAERAALYRGILKMATRAQPERVRISREDVAGGLASGVLVILTAFPAVVPFLFMDDPFRALRVSNAILVGLLFFCGFFWARYTGVNRWFAGLAMLLIGLVLVQAAILLGG